MNYIEAIRAAVGGAKVRRAGSPDGFFVFVDGGRIMTEVHILGGQLGFIPTLADVLADDWEIIEMGHDWAWALDRLREGEQVRRMVWLGGVSMGPHGGTGYLHTSCGVYPQMCWFDATDWVLA